jgi:hypothetical protein
LVILGAEIVIITGDAVILVIRLALTGFGHTQGLRAEGILGSVADDYRGWVDFAVLFETDQRAVTDIAIFIFNTIRIHLAAADLLQSGLTGTLFTEITYRAGITIIALQLIGIMRTARFRMAHIIGAGIFVITVDLGTRACPLDTAVVGGAQVLVITGEPVLHRGVGTTALMIAGIFGAGIGIVTLQRFAVSTKPIAAGLIDGAGIVVIAGFTIQILMHTPIFGST